LAQAAHDKVVTTHLHEGTIVCDMPSLSKVGCFVLLLGDASSLHERNFTNTANGKCVSPGICTAPSTKYSRVAGGPKPGQQWNINGGFCGAWSTQQASLGHGAWISQDLVRKANSKQQIAHGQHGDTTEGYEVLPNNVAFTAENLRLTYDEWDYTQPAPQAQAYKKFLKKHLVKGHPVVWFPLCKGDGTTRYTPTSCPSGGLCNHVEPMFGIFSDHPLDDENVYDDDWILHASDQDLMPYYRKMSTLQDSTTMDGNCANAQPGFGRNEMYPCFDQHVTYGLAVTGLDVKGTLPVSLEVDITEEPNVRQSGRAKAVHGSVTVSGLQSGKKYTLYRYAGTDTLPKSAPFSGAEHETPFTATGSTWTFQDPNTFMSNTAVYYVAAAAAEEAVAV